MRILVQETFLKWALRKNRVEEEEKGRAGVKQGCGLICSFSLTPQGALEHERHQESCSTLSQGAAFSYPNISQSLMVDCPWVLWCHLLVRCLPLAQSLLVGSCRTRGPSIVVHCTPEFLLFLL